MLDQGPAAGTTGRWLVSFGRDAPGGRGATGAQVAALRSCGVQEVATSSDIPGAVLPEDAAALVLERLGVAILREAPERSLAAAAVGAVRRVEAERVVSIASSFVDDGERTWALQALGRGTRTLTGHGVSVAVLDTGVDLSHPDLGALVASTSLVPGEDAQDQNGHGTHCAGVVCGQGTGPAYGVAPEASLHVGKVLGASGAGGLGDVLAGIDWAAEQGCRVVSMSLGSPPDADEPYSEIFEEVAADLLAEPRSVHLVAAAGNESRRAEGVISPVGIPASSPAVIAVGAVDRELAVADFSNGGPSLTIAAPGVEVLSAWPGGGRTLLSGTSMAAPHAAGVLALILAAEPYLTGSAVVERLRRLARSLPFSATDVGAGLSQRP